MPYDPHKIAESIFEEWFEEVSEEFPRKIAELAKTKIKAVLADLLSGKKDVDKIVNEIDESLIEKIVRSGGKPADFIRRMEIFMRIASSKLNELSFLHFTPVFTNFEAKFLQKVVNVYERIVNEEITLRERIERALKVLSRVNQAVLQARSEMSLLEEVCKIIVNEGGYVYAWIGYAEEDKTVKPVAKAGSNGYADAIKITWDNGKTGKGPTGVAIRTGKPTISRDILTDVEFEPWREEALKRGYASSIALPLIYHDKVFGALNIYSDVKNAFDEEEANLLKELADNVAYGIAMIRAKKEKEKIEELYKLVIENTGTGMLVIDENGKIIFVNDETINITGFSKEELIGKHFIELVAEEDRDRVLANYKLRLVDSKLAPKSYEVKFVDAKGNIRHALVTVTLIPGTKRLVVSFVDITGLKKAERKMRRSELRYRTIFEASPLPIVLVGIDTTIIDCNRAALNLVGKPRREVIGRKWVELEIFDEKDLPYVMELFYRGLRGKTEVVELKINVDGEKWLNVFPRLLEENGKPHAFLVIIEDITDKKMTEKQLKETLEQLRILRSIDLGIIEGKPVRELMKEIIKDLKQKVKCDIACISVFGEEVVTEPEEFCSILKDREGINALKVREKDGIVLVEDILKLDDLSEIELVLLKARMKCYLLIPLIARGEEVGVLLISSKKEIGKDGIEFVRQIAGQLAIALHEALLYELKKKAYNQIEKNIEDFATLIDHIRNPLATIMALAEVEIQKRDRELSERIIREVERIEDVIEKLDRGWLESEKIREFLRKG